MTGQATAPVDLGPAHPPSIRQKLGGGASTSAITLEATGLPYTYDACTGDRVFGFHHYETVAAETRIQPIPTRHSDYCPDALLPRDPTDARADLGDYLVDGNTLVVIVITATENALRAVYPQLKASELCGLDPNHSSRLTDWFLM
ncbi:hypothetical protein BST61_g5044 [Cercospora zeina]